MHIMHIAYAHTRRRKGLVQTMANIPQIIKFTIALFYLLVSVPTAQCVFDASNTAALAQNSRLPSHTELGIRGKQPEGPHSSSQSRFETQYTSRQSNVSDLTRTWNEFGSISAQTTDCACPGGCRIVYGKRGLIDDGFAKACPQKGISELYMNLIECWYVCCVCLTSTGCVSLSAQVLQLLLLSMQVRG
jgi:hypothetical protein